MSKKLYYSTGIVALLLFLILTFYVKSSFTSSPIPWLDNATANFLTSLQNNQFLVSLSSIFAKYLGDFMGLIVAAVIFILLLFFKQSKGALWMIGLIIVGVGGNTLIKSFVGRERPDIHRLTAFANESGKSFASGHSVFTTLLFGSLFFILAQKISRRFVKTLLGILAVLLIFAVMASRVLIGVHYPSDTLGGLLLGIFLLFITYPLVFKRTPRIEYGDHRAPRRSRR